MEYSVRVYDHDGRNPTELENAVIDSVVNHDEEITKVVLELPLTDSKYKDNPEALLRMGNLAQVKFSHLKDWAGVVWSPQISDEKKGTIKVTLYSPHHILDKRYPSRAWGKDKTGGATLLHMLQAQRKRGGAFPILATEDTINTGGRKLRVGIQPDISVFRNLQDLAKKTRHEFWFDNSLIDGELRFTLNWKRRKIKRGDPIVISHNGAQWGTPSMSVTGGLSTAFQIFEEGRNRQAGRWRTEDTDQPLNDYGRWEGQLREQDIESGSGKNSGALRREIQKTAIPKVFYKVNLPLDEVARTVEPGSRHLLWGDKVGVDPSGLIGTRNRVRTVATQYKIKNEYLEAVFQRWQGAELKEFIP